ncbi:hypothetical protein HPB49_004170 [Dermacentor silvarum]|uniref:Uncharacterized protein n=1 Tax=Dermacentor silvarum TaxID=543639 RepID=A0ACB8CPR2_DERSI|nr:hypothetical protein HPB49_004170 [Dermacentor silvarum]
MVAKWYAIHDIGGLKLGGQQEEPFYATDDERLLWLEVGILHAAKTGNASSSSKSKAVISLPSQHNDVPSCPVEIKHAARELSGELECVNYWSYAQDELEIAPIAFLAGYLARACDEKVCSIHFVDGRPTKDYPYPTLQLGTQLYAADAILGLTQSFPNIATVKKVDALCKPPVVLCRLPILVDCLDHVVVDN